MNFKAYDILSSLVPGFLAVLILLNALKMQYDKEKVVAYTAVAFLLGYLMNAVSSWLEDLYNWSWGGKPSDRLLDGKNIWKVSFYQSAKVKSLLLTESGNPNASNDELFSIAMRYGNGQSRVDDFNAMYAFARVLLTTVLIGTVILLVDHYDQLEYYVFLLPTLFAVWLRCKQRGYYYAREVLNVYLRAKEQ